MVWADGRTTEAAESMRWEERREKIRQHAFHSAAPLVVPPVNRRTATAFLCRLAARAAQPDDEHSSRPSTCLRAARTCPSCCIVLVPPRIAPPLPAPRRRAPLRPPAEHAGLHRAPTSPPPFLAYKEALRDAPELRKPLSHHTPHPRPCIAAAASASAHRTCFPWPARPAASSLERRAKVGALALPLSFPQPVLASGRSCHAAHGRRLPATAMAVAPLPADPLL
ncbi:uncharacterized protein LOC120713430 [Panicum virgatum]|uniref:uncharacterized protein LOC120713430 n=1 Tax=Panicum virgatum TaxID=38727 RepID=UPI0019D5C4D6|nr:uncharacterized protein LOC120713430 [Panicum virgatum]